MEKAKKGDWVEIEEIILKPEERAPQVPEDTKRVPLVQWMRGYLLEEEGSLGEMVTIETLIGRKVKGKLCDVSPRHVHDFGKPVKELIDVGIEIRKELKETKH